LPVGDDPTLVNLVDGQRLSDWASLPTYNARTAPKTMALKKIKRTSKSESGSKQKTYYVAAEYVDHNDRLLVENGKNIELYSVDLKLAQHWYAAAWRGNRFDLSAFRDKRIGWDLEPEQAEEIKNSGLVLAQCLRHGDGMPVVEKYKGNPIYGSAVDVLIGEVFEAALGYLIEEETGIAGLTISAMHTGYALHEGRPVGRASIGVVARNVVKERPDLTAQAAPNGTVTILFSDVVDSTAINERIGDQEWMRLLREHNEIIRRQKALHAGYEVKTIGDAFMLAFRSARDALNCAIGIERAFSKRNRTARQQIQVRIGLHTGELVHEDDDFYGRHVNFAARVASKADAREILVSSLLRDVVEPSGEFSFEARKPEVLKGFAKKHALHVVRWADV
jgi:class 3 adenylate cyclase